MKNKFFTFYDTKFLSSFWKK